MTEPSITLLIVSLAFVFALAIALTVTIIKLYLVKKDAREIDESLEDILNKDTNALITMSSQDKDMRTLAVSLNKRLAAIRQKQLTYNNGDAKLKNAMTNISHDLRTPLTAICGYLDLIEKEKNPAKIKEYLDIVKERTLTLKTLTDELFKYSVSLDKSHGVYLQDVCLNTLIRECLLDQYEQFNQKNITPVIDLPQKNINCVADKKDLARVFQNIIGNALKYGEGDFGVKLYEDGVIDFYNTASGLTQLDVERMFDRFYTVKNNKFSTGLGLSIARSLTEQYGGSVQANLKDNILHIRLKFTVNS